MYASIGRVNETRNLNGPPTYTGLSRMIFFCEVSRQIQYYMHRRRVCCEGSGLTTPILLSNAEDNVVMDSTPTKKRLAQERKPF